MKTKFCVAIVLVVLVFSESGATFASRLCKSGVLGICDVVPFSMPGSRSIRGMFKGSPIVVVTSDAFAGAIFSLSWNGKEFINSHDHGRLIQSASSFDGKSECFNPTEGGSRSDGTDLTTTSVLEFIAASKNHLHTVSRMAFWLRPGETSTSEGCKRGSIQGSALNTAPLSMHVLDKTVTIGFQGIPNVIEHRITFIVPEAHQTAKFTILAEYLPINFTHIYLYDPWQKRLARAPSIVHDQSLPVIFATSDEEYAIGVFSPDKTQSRTPLVYAAYGGDTFPGRIGDPTSPTVTMQCIAHEAPVPAKNYNYRCYTVIGTLSDVVEGMNRLQVNFSGGAPF